VAERVLVTGVLGCVGAWTARLLLEEGVDVVGFDLGTSTHRLELVMTPEQRARLTLVPGDIADLAALGRALDEHEIARVVHLAALQVPLCKADPALGARVNVLGTVNVFEAVKARRERIPHVVYASSVAVYGPGDTGAQDERTQPETHYGVYKAANEGTARVYAHDDGLPSIGMRPCCVYGPGRDQGLTSSPTGAMLAAARHEGFRISFGGTTRYQYAPDVARALLAATRIPVEDAVVFNLAGTRAHMSAVVAAIESAAPEVTGKITFDDVALPFPDEFEAQEPLTIAWTPLGEGVRETVEHFRRRDRDES
jgi:UDP-glucuronate 4-epimerase